MLTGMYMINSAGFDFAEVDLTKETFFEGENASGKSTTTRNICYLYHSFDDKSKLGISRGKDKFSKHHFKYEKGSYIIYTFIDFFIFVYKSGGEIHRYFSRQSFLIDKIKRNSQIVDFKEIIDYIKSAPHWIKPKTITEYQSLLYGQHTDKSFMIANIESYDKFLEIYTQVFNVEHSMVDAKNIKEAIQKSIKIDNDISIQFDHDAFIKELNDFKREYELYVVFDNNRENIKQAREQLYELSELEEETKDSLSKINYRYHKESQYIKEFEKRRIEIKETIKNIDNELKNVKNELNINIPNKKQGLGKLEQSIINIEKESEEYNEFEYEQHLERSSQKDSLERMKNSKVVFHGKLTDEQTDKFKIIEDEIFILEQMIKNDIPNRFKNKEQNLIIEQNKQYLQNRNETEKVRDNKVNNVEKTIKDYKLLIDDKEHSKQDLRDKLLNEKDELRDIYDSNVETCKLKIQNNKQLVLKKEDFISSIDKDIKLQYELIYEVDKDNEERKRLGHKNLKEKVSNKVQLIRVLNNIIRTKPNSLREFLNEEVDGWEKSIYPLIDKNLLLIDIETLKPSYDLDSTNESMFGLKLDTSVLKSEKTVLEASNEIKKLKSDMKLLVNSYKEERKKFNLDCESRIQKIKIKIESLENDKVVINKEITKILEMNFQIEEDIKKITNEYQKKREELERTYKKQNEEIQGVIDELEQKIQLQKKLITDIKEEFEKDIEKLEKLKLDNIKIIKDNSIKEMNIEINKKEKEIQSKLLDKDSISNNEMIQQLELEIKSLTQEIESTINSKNWLEHYEKVQSKVEQLPQMRLDYEISETNIKEDIKRLSSKSKILHEQKLEYDDEKRKLLEEEKLINQGLESFKKEKINELELADSTLTDELLKDLIYSYRNIKSLYIKVKSQLREKLVEIKDIERFGIFDIRLNLEMFDNTDNINKLGGIRTSLEFLENQRISGMETRKKTKHVDLARLVKSLIPGKIDTLNALHGKFIEQKNKINKNLKKADFSVIKNIKIDIDNNETKKGSLSLEIKELSDVVDDLISYLSDEKSLFFDRRDSQKKINILLDKLTNIKKLSDSGSIHLYDTIDLSLSFIENGKLYTGVTNYGDESSTGGNVIIKVVIAMAILNMYVESTNENSPFFLVVDEVGKLEIENQIMLRDYINNCGFKTLFITPNPIDPDKEKAIYYDFKNIKTEGGSLEIRRMNNV
ncbi:hypothetical protein CRV00_05635 [Malaciobacter molluscorum]|uniref:ATP-binding protein n=1 Tax=Malaciobacter molluscorum TaxID=1032072 RepID=UPI00100A669B|nr:ATP-binding protein [Malaciobacter molluscorum]RXJ94813.1 hypothetical protein CRV00_05635 [Malaciobacter molluscorum]